MGKRIIPRARGKGGPRYRAPSHRYFGRVDYASVTGIVGRVKDIVNDPARSAPVAIIKFDDGKEILHVAAEGLKVGDVVAYGGEATVGNVLKLRNIPVGMRVYAVENSPGSGPKFCRSGGSFATVAGKSDGVVKLLFPSGKTTNFNANCRATVGIPAGGGRLEKPFAKAGKRHYALMARGKLYPRVKGVSMTATDHPYGGSSKRPRGGKAVSRTAPPGAKVGSISPRRMGRRKGR